MFKRILSLFTCVMLFSTQVMAETIQIDKLLGLQRNPKADRIDDGAHDRFDNVYINYGNLEVVKGRDRLNSTAHTDTVVNGFWYYENQSGTTKKYVVAESDELVTYDTDGTNRTQIASGLTNEKWDAVQIENTLYLTSSTNGLYKWAGSGSATLITGVSAASSATFTAATTEGGLTPGLDAIIQVKIQSLSVQSTGSARYPNSGSSCVAGPLSLEEVSDSTSYTDEDCNNLNTTNWITSCATSSNYKYKLTAFNSIAGIESEASSATSVSLNGSDIFDSTVSDIYTIYGSSTTCAANPSTKYRSNTVVVNLDNRQTSTTTTLPAAPSSPFDSYCIYRTVASGSDFFRLGCKLAGSSTYTDGTPDTVLGSPLDTTIDTIDPPSFRYIEEYKGAIFVAEGNLVKFSKIPVTLITDADKYWLDTDELQVFGTITGLKKISDSLLIFTDKVIYQVSGFGADSFRLIPIINGVGSINDETIEVDTNGDIIFFDGTTVYKLKVGQQDTDTLTGTSISQAKAALTKLSSPNLDSVFRGEDSQIVLDKSTFVNSHAYYDADNDRYFIYIDKDCFIFDQKANSWSRIPATQMLASVWRKSANSQGVGALLDNVGFFFNNWTGYENGVHSGSVTGIITSSTNSTLVCSTCSFNTTNDGLKGLWIYLDNENKEYHQITSNTGTAITITDTWMTNPIISDKFYIAYIIPRWRTKQYSFIKPPDESKVSILYLNHNKSDSTQNIDVYSFQNKSETAVYAATKNLATNFIDTFNTRMRSSWIQWEFRSYVYNTSNSINPPIDIVSYAVDADAERSLT